VGVGPVTADSQVLAAEDRADSRSGSLLADRQVGGAAHLLLGVAVGDRLLNRSDADHVAQDTKGDAGV
jgi:hypothetical protein